MKVTLTINNERKEVDANPGANLMDTLRELGYSGVKNGCAEGVCGSCMVLVDGAPRKSCLMLIGQVKDKEVTTIEGLATPKAPHPIQDQFVEKAGIQCGFCIPGMIISAVAMLEVNPDPTDEEIKLGLEGNLCRCTGYKKQIEAVKEGARIIKEAF